MMASSFPSSIDAFPEPLANSPLNAPSHSGLHQDVNDAVEKIEVKLGVGDSPASGASAGQVLKSSGGGSTGWSDIVVGDIDATGRAANDVIVADGAGNAAWSGAAGLWLVKTQTFTSVGTSGLLFTDVFTSEFRNYRAVINIDTSSQNLGLFGRFGSIASPYNYATLGLTAGNVADNVSQSGGSAFLIGYIRSGTNFHNFHIDIFNPNETGKTTTATYTGFSDNAAGNSSGHRSGSCLLNDGTAVTGFTLLTSAGTVNGTIRVYGYRN
jgi:hypothetical protein